MKYSPSVIVLIVILPKETSSWDAHIRDPILRTKGVSLTMLLTIQLKKPNNRRIIFGCLGDNLANGAFFLYLAKCSRVIFIPPSWWIFSLPLRPSRLQLKTITGNHAATSPTSPLLLQVHCILQGHPLHTRGLTNVVGRWIHRKNHSGWLSSPSFLGYKQKKYSTVKEGGGKKQTGI